MSDTAGKHQGGPLASGAVVTGRTCGVGGVTPPYPEGATAKCMMPAEAAAEAEWEGVEVMGDRHRGGWRRLEDG